MAETVLGFGFIETAVHVFAVPPPHFEGHAYI